MANDFDNVRLPEDIERGTTGGPSFKTTVITMASGKEQRNQEWEVVRGTYDIGYGIQDRDDLEKVYAFFHARRGRLRGFRFRDWLDFSVTAGPVGTIPGQPNQRQLVRQYADVEVPYIRIITKPVIGTLKVYKNFVITDDYTLLDDGVIQFPTDPGGNVLATFDFDIPVRFDIDSLKVQLTTYRAGSIPSIQIIELI